MHATRWAAVAGFPGYEVSDLGDVRDASGRALRQSISHRGNRIVALRLLGKRTTRHVRRLVAHAFLEISGPGRVHLIDGDRLNCAATNLEFRPLRNVYRVGSRYVARVKVGDRRKYVGTFPTEFEAARHASLALAAAQLSPST